MGTLFDHIPHPHIEARKESGPAKVKGGNKSFNDKIGVLITTVVGTMWAAYLFAVLAAVSLPSAILSHNSIIIVGWLAQTFLQLVLLPVIIVGQNVQSRAADKRSEQTYNDAEAILHESLQVHDHLEAQDDKIENLEALLKTLIEASKPKPRITKKATADVV